MGHACRVFREISAKGMYKTEPLKGFSRGSYLGCTQVCCTLPSKAGVGAEHGKYSDGLGALSFHDWWAEDDSSGLLLLIEMSR